MTRIELRKMLPTGFRKEISTRSGYSTTYVDKWFAGKIENLKIENSALEYLAEILEKKKLLTERIKNAL